MIKQLALASVLALSSNLLYAGDQYVDESGYAASGYDVVAFFGLDQAAIGQQQPEAIPGKKAITAEYNGAKWAFSSEENRDLFNANPAKYAPQYDGHCAYGVSQGGKVPANPNLWRITGEKLYLNINPPVVGFFEEDIPGHLKSAEKNWDDLESAPASAKSWKSLKANNGTYSMESPI